MRAQFIASARSKDKTMLIADKLMTIEEFERLPNNGQPMELVRGRIVEMNVPKPRHGEVCSLITEIVGSFARQHDIGRTVANDAGVITQRNPDSLRGADVAFYSFRRVPKGPLPAGYLNVVPEIVFEVLSDDDRWSQVLEKIAEYLNAGVGVVCVLDPKDRTLQIYTAVQPAQTLTAGEQFALPEHLGSFSVAVARFFD
jgi:Uma2 family endonuclease